MTKLFETTVSLKPEQLYSEISNYITNEFRNRFETKAIFNSQGYQGQRNVFIISHEQRKIAVFPPVSDDERGYELLYLKTVLGEFNKLGNAGTTDLIIPIIEQRNVAPFIRFFKRSHSVLLHIKPGTDEAIFYDSKGWLSKLYPLGAIKKPVFESYPSIKFKTIYRGDQSIFNQTECGHWVSEYLPALINNKPLPSSLTQLTNRIMPKYRRKSLFEIIGIATFLFAILALIALIILTPTPVAVAFHLISGSLIGSITTTISALSTGIPEVLLEVTGLGFLTYKLFSHFLKAELQNLPTSSLNRFESRIHSLLTNSESIPSSKRPPISQRGEITTSEQKWQGRGILVDTRGNSTLSFFGKPPVVEISSATSTIEKARLQDS